MAHQECCIGRGLGALHSKRGEQSFLLYSTYAAEPELNRFNSEGTVFGSISRGALEELAINIPSKKTMARFDAIISPLDAMIRCNHDENLLLQGMRDLLLPKLMSGEIDVSKVALEAEKSGI